MAKSLTRAISKWALSAAASVKQSDGECLGPDTISAKTYLAGSTVVRSSGVSPAPQPALSTAINSQTPDEALLRAIANAVSSAPPTGTGSTLERAGGLLAPTASSTRPGKHRAKIIQSKAHIESIYLDGQLTGTTSSLSASKPAQQLDQAVRSASGRRNGGIFPSSQYSCLANLVIVNHSNARLCR